MHDPFQTHQALGAQYGVPTQLGLPYGALQASAMNPLTAMNPFIAQAYQGLAGQGQGQIGPQQSPFTQGLGQPQIGQLFAQNPLLATLLNQQLLNNQLLNNQLLAGLQTGHHQAYPQFGQIGQIGSPFQQQTGLPHGQAGGPFGQTGSMFGQTPSPFGQVGYPLAPQSWVGQGIPFGGGQAFSQVSPLLAQLSGRSFPGISPWGY